MSQQREKALESYQEKALKIFELIKEAYPEENLFTLQASFLILLIPLIEDRAASKYLIKHLAKTLDAGEQIGLLPKPEELSDFKPLLKIT